MARPRYVGPGHRQQVALSREARDLARLWRDAGLVEVVDRKPPRGAWIELKAYRRACVEVEALLARDPRDWVGCSYGKDQAVMWALNARDDAYKAAQVWAIELMWRVEEHAAAND